MQKKFHNLKSSCRKSSMLYIEMPQDSELFNSSTEVEIVQLLWVFLAKWTKVWGIITVRLCAEY